MYRYYLRLLCFIFIIQLFGLSRTNSQDLTGIWKGYFITESGDYYKLEFQILHNGKSSITGVSYSYLDVRFYGKATMTGNFIGSSSTFRIREVKTVEVKSLLGGATCIMNYNLQYSRSGKEEFLEGSYLGMFERKDNQKSGYWGDCGGGKVHLRRVTTSDFYVEPFLKNKLQPKKIIYNEAPPVKREKNDTPANPEKNNTIKTENKTNTNPAPPPPSQKENKTEPKEEPRPLQKPNTTPQKTSDMPKIDLLKPSEKPKPKENVPVPSVLKTRENELVKTFEVDVDEITVKLYDNGEIDGDTISVYLDNKLVLASKRLTASPLTVKIKMEEEKVHELTMVAENLGSIPPNTSLMVVEAGDQRYEVRITSTEQKNAVVRFRYRKKN
ncbi:MAG: hypothetical protein N2747_05850 [Chitinophagaceae bacterium]|nr:hypothetical protein [Chitinophagaceae bacterium]